MNRQRARVLPAHLAPSHAAASGSYAARTVMPTSRRGVRRCYARRIRQRSGVVVPMWCAATDWMCA